MTIHCQTVWSVRCDGCIRAEEMGAGLDVSARLPIPRSWLTVLDADGVVHHYHNLRCARRAQRHAAKSRLALVRP